LPYAAVVLVGVSVLLGGVILALQAPFDAATDTSCSWPLIRALRGYDGDTICEQAGRSRLWASVALIVVWVAAVALTLTAATRAARHRGDESPAR
jgi:hypothetical protein